MRWLFGAAALAFSILPQNLPFTTRSLGGSSSLIQSTDLTYLGAERVPTGGAIDFQFTRGGVSTRRVGGSLHYFIYGANGDTHAIQHIDSGSSSTVFTVPSGEGSHFPTGTNVAMKRAAQSSGTLPEASVVSNRSGDTITVSPAFGGTPAASDTLINLEQVGMVYELVDSNDPACNTGAPNTTYSSAPRMCLYAMYPATGAGGGYYRRWSWEVDGSDENPSGVLPAGIYWNESESMLYLAYQQVYATNNVGFSVVGCTLGSVVSQVGSMTCYGPWRTVYTDSDGVTQRGGKTCQWITADPQGRMTCSSWAVGQLDSTMSWGPTIRIRSGAWPNTGTTGGFGSTDLTFDKTGANYYNMQNTGSGGQASNHVDSAGVLTGALRSARRAFQPQVFEDFTNYNTDYGPQTRIDPATNNSVSSWDGEDSVGGFVWLSLTHKSGIIFTGVLSDGHDWYTSSGQVSMTFTGAPSGGTPQAGETITASGGKSAQVKHWNSPGSGVLGAGLTGLGFAVSDVVTGGTSGFTATIATYKTQAKCTHNVDCIICPTGGTTTSSFPNFWMVDPADAAAVEAGSKTDYTVDPYAEVDLQDTYGVQVAPLATNGAGNAMNGLAYDATSGHLIGLARMADDTAPYASNDPAPLIHVWGVSDAAPPPISGSGLAALLVGTLLCGPWRKRRQSIKAARATDDGEPASGQHARAVRA